MAGLGTGGTLMGNGRRFKEELGDRVKIVAAEPMQGEPVQGLRSLDDGFIPPIIDLSLLDRKIFVTNRDAVIWTRKLLDEEGVFAGVSSGAIASIAVRIAGEMDEGNVVFIVCDDGWKYLSWGIYTKPVDEIETSTPPSGGRPPVCPDVIRRTAYPATPNIGPLELVIMPVIALIVLGPKRLPEVGRSIGKGLREFKESLTAIDHDDEDERPDQKIESSRASTPRCWTIIAHAQRDAPNECCGIVATRDGEAVAVHELENIPPARCASRWTGSSCSSPGAFEDEGLDLGAIYHSHTRSAPYPSQTDVNFARRLAGHRMADRRPRRDEPTCAPTSSTPGRAEVDLGDGPLSRSSARRAATPSLDERFCRECGMPLVHAGRSASTWRSARHMSGRARSSRSTPTESSCASSARVTRPRPNSSRDCCSRKACRR